MLFTAYHTQKPSVNQQITPHKVSMIPLGILTTTIIISTILNYLLEVLNV